ncbi:MAG: aldehyde dehydrogenase family protein [Bdellovibrionia bacterium]
MAFRITYSVLEADLSQLHREFDTTLSQMERNLGTEFPSWIDGKPFQSGVFLDDKNPAKITQTLARFHSVPTSEIDRIMDISEKAQKAWGATPWQERVKIIKNAAELISERRLEIAAVMSLEVGKNRMESLGDVEESADLFRYYAGQMEEANGFYKPLGKLSPNEKTGSYLKPFGIFAVISPFNFPMALAAGMSGAALLGGNSVVLKPSSETPWCGQKLYECLRDAGLPNGVFQVVHGPGGSLGNALVNHPKIKGLAFTGSKEVGMKLMRVMTSDYAKPCLLEMGVKNPAIVCAKADLDKAVEGCMRSAFGMSGQKCSALSRVYVHRSLQKEFTEQFIQKAQSLKIGDPTMQENYLGPVINEKAYNRHMSAVTEAKKDGKILLGGENLRTHTKYKDGYFVEPILASLPRGHRLIRDELFTPFLLLDTFDTLEEAVQQANQCDYGLTAGVFSEVESDVNYFMEHIEAGVLYANRKTGATTGAWPGVQAFSGWKGSGSTGKGGCGPYYVSQFMREQSQTRMQ